MTMMVLMIMTLTKIKDDLIIIVDNPREKLGAAGAGGRRDTYTAGSYFPLASLASLAILAHHQL